VKIKFVVDGGQRYLIFRIRRQPTLNSPFGCFCYNWKFEIDYGMLRWL